MHHHSLSDAGQLCIFLNFFYMTRPYWQSTFPKRSLESSSLSLSLYLIISITFLGSVYPYFDQLPASHLRGLCLSYTRPCDRFSSFSHSIGTITGHSCVLLYEDGWNIPSGMLCLTKVDNIDNMYHKKYN